MHGHKAHYGDLNGKGLTYYVSLDSTEYHHPERAMNTKKVPAEVYSRVVGYFRPVSQWNDGKKEEFKERRPFAPEQLPARIACGELANV